ncbi:MAG: LysR family transcriptional regulator [Motiliproteus sp.]|nr:LysR family transcriptional regulator [Motiliproteus sp.]MCW9052542.1 LysR family transcriptional regulator [Motiliproteus sp.]
MDIELLRTFLEVSKTRHFARAAENLYLTQSAVSFRVKQLEQIVGVDLFIRQRNNIRLTPSGERLVSHAQNMLAAWQLALQDVGVSEQQEMQLSLGGITSLWETFLQSLLPYLAKEFPATLIRTVISSHIELTQSLIENRMDIAVVLDPPNLAELAVHKVGKIELVLVASHEETRIGTIDQLGYVYVNWGTASNIKHAKLFKKPVPAVLHTEHSQIALEYIASQGGAAFLPLAIVQPYIDRRQLFLVPGTKPSSRNVFAVYSKDSPKIGQITSIVELLTQFELKPQIPTVVSLKP